MKKGKSKIWIVYTFVFVAITILLLSIIIWNTFWGFISIVLLALTISVGNILKAFFNKNINEDINYKLDKEAIRTPNNEDVKNSKKLLRYATAILAFLSLITTSQGMKSFVFHESWMAFLGSFAVQSILVVFSLLLCQLFVRISILNWPPYIKKAVNETMIFFFCTALVISSMFSFCFIANNAYKDTWPADSEIIIQEFLLKESEKLKEENNDRGKKILDYINIKAEEDLEPAVRKSRKVKEDKWNNEIDAEVKIFQNKSKLKNNVNINKKELLKMYPQYKKDVSYLCKHYNKYSKQYKEAISLYNSIIKEIQSWDSSDYNIMFKQSEQWINEIEDMNIKLKNRKETIKGLKTFRLNTDFSVVRSEYISETKNLRTVFSHLKMSLNRINKICRQINESSSSKDELNDILSDIYLLDISVGETEANAEKVKVEDIINKINKLALTVSEDEDSDSEVVENIINIKDALKQYIKYSELKNKLYEKKNKIYIICLHNKKVSNKDNDEVININYKDWKKARNEDLNTFCAYLKLLPDLSLITSQTEVKDMENTKYEVDSIFEKAKTCQRDLLGDLTDFEKAFNYFKYRFPMMAFFSAFIAIFFDFGSFLTGCFLYATEYFESDSSVDCKK